VISSFLLEDIQRHESRLFEVRAAFKRTLLLGVRAYISAYRCRLLQSPQQTTGHKLMPKSLQPQPHARSICMYAGPCVYTPHTLTPYSLAGAVLIRLRCTWYSFTRFYITYMHRQFVPCVVIM